MPARLSAPLQRPAALFAAAFLLLVSALATAGGSVVLVAATGPQAPSSNGQTPIAFPSVPHVMALTIVYGMAYLGLLVASAAGIVALAFRQRRFVSFYAAAIAFEYLVSTALGAAAIGTLYHRSNHATAIHACVSAVTGIPSDLTAPGQVLDVLPKFEAGAARMAEKRCQHAYSTMQALVLALWITTRVAEPVALLAILAYRRMLPAHRDPRNLPFDPEQGMPPDYMKDTAHETDALPEYTPGSYLSHAVDEKDFDLADEDDAESPWGAAGDSSMVDIDLMAEAAAGDEAQYTSPNEGFKVFYVNMAHHHRPRPRASKTNATPHTVFTRHAEAMDLNGKAMLEHLYPARGHRPTISVPSVLPPSSFKKHTKANKSYAGRDSRVMVEPAGYDEENDPEAASADDDVPGGTYAATTWADEKLGAPDDYGYRAASFGAGDLRALSPPPGDGHGGARQSHESNHSAQSSDSGRTIVVTCRVGDEGEDEGKDRL